MYSIEPEDIVTKRSVITDTSSIRKWLTADRFPSIKSLKELHVILNKLLSESKINYPISVLCEDIEPLFADIGLLDLQSFVKSNENNVPSFITTILAYCATKAKCNIKTRSRLQPVCQSQDIKTQAIIFDFDGTLTTCKANRTTWEYIWTKLGYDVSMCQYYHKQFDEKKITHPEWCSITEKYFKDRDMNLQILKEIATEIKLMPGIEKFLSLMREHDIKLYIVSGSIFHVIRYALGPYFSYFDGIKANQFFFNDDDKLLKIVGTAYDFEGKSEYIKMISHELRIDTYSILFVGNSLNDEYAYRSGAKTLCINPKLTDFNNKTIWHNCLERCHDLNEIFPFLNL